MSTIDLFVTQAETKPEDIALDPLAIVRARAAAKLRWWRRNRSMTWKCRLCGKKITHRGVSADSLNLHHIDRDPWNPRARLVPVHQRCNAAIEAETRQRIYESRMET